MTEQEIRELLRGLVRLGAEADRLQLGGEEVFGIVGTILAHVAFVNIGDRAPEVFQEECWGRGVET